MLGSPITPHNKARMNAAELDADLWLDRARDLCGHREALVDQLKGLGTQLQTASSEEAAALRPKSHSLLRELREAACHVCEAAQQYRDACRDPDAPLAYKDEDYLAKMAHDLDFMGESEALVAAIGTPRRLLRNNPLMLPRPLRAAELDVEDAPPKNAEQARLRRAESILVGASIAQRNPKAPSSLDMMIEDQGSSLDALSPQPEEEEEPEPEISEPPKPATPKPQFANQPTNVNDDWVREAHAQLKELREAQAQLPLERGDPELAAMNNNPALERFKPVLEGKKRAPPRPKKLVELSTEGAYADADARSYIAPPPRRAKKHQNRHRAQIVDKLERLQRSEGPLLPQIKMGGPPPGLKKMRKKKGRPLQGVTLARAELSAIDLTADDLEDIAALDDAPNEAARRVGACALTLMCRGDRCPPDASWNAVIRAFDDDPDGVLRAIRAVDAKSDVPPFKARALSRLLASGGLDATASFEHVDSEAGEALGRLAAWCSRCVRAALRAAERASDDESSVPPRRGRRRAARDDDSYQSDLSSLNTTPRGMIKRRARRRKKKVVAPPPVIQHSKNEASFKTGRVMMASWWRFEAASAACLVSVVAPSSAKGNSHALLVKAYDPTRGDGESVLVLDAATVDRLRNHETLENFVRTQGLLRKLELRVSAHGAAKLRERAGPPTGAPAAPPGGGPRVSGGLRKRQAASAPVVEKEAVDAVPPRAIETAPPAKPASAKARFAERQRAAEAERLAQEREEKARLAQARLEKAARAEAKRRLAAERAAEDARRAKAATALQSRARGRSATARTKEAFAAVVRVQAAWRCRVGAQALGVAKSSAVALQSALRGKSGREAAQRKRAAKEQAKRDAERRRREAERRAAEARRLEAEEAERKRQAFEAKQRAAAEEQRRADDYATAKAREAAALSARRREREAAEARARAEAEAARRRDEAAALARAPSASASELASESDDGYGDDDFDEFSPAKTTGPPSPAQRRVPPVPLDPSSSDDGYGDSDFDDFDDE